MITLLFVWLGSPHEYAIKDEIPYSIEQVEALEATKAGMLYMLSIADLCLCCEDETSTITTIHAPASNNVRSGAPNTNYKMDSKSRE